MPNPVLVRLRPMRDFLASESAGGATLIFSALVALVWSNVGPDSYDRVWGLNVIGLTLHVWVNDLLMAGFFLLVGLELRREMVSGELASPARLAAPGFAALGGMIVPALIYVAFNRADPAALRGWAVPVATDIAFALAVLSVLGRRVPLALRVFLAALAIIDDLGAIVIIALFYTSGLSLLALGGAVAAWGAMYALNRAGVRALWPYLLGGAVLWILVFQSGVHATLAGVALAFVVPMRGGAQSTAQRLENALETWVALLVLPLFGLSNAGLHVGTLPARAWADPVALGVALGLLMGKQLGVFGGLMLARGVGLAALPSGVTRPQLYGAAILCGVGFTMSLFIADLAFRNAPRGDEVKLAVFTGSILSALLGLLVLGLVSPKRAA